MLPPARGSRTLPPAPELAGARLAGAWLGRVGAVAPAAGGSGRWQLTALPPSLLRAQGAPGADVRQRPWQDAVQKQRWRRVGIRIGWLGGHCGLALVFDSYEEHKLQRFRGTAVRKGSASHPAALAGAPRWQGTRGEATLSPTPPCSLEWVRVSEQAPARSRPLPSPPMLSWQEPALRHWPASRWAASSGYRLGHKASPRLPACRAPRVTRIPQQKV